MTRRPRTAASRMAGLFGVFTGSAVLLFLGTFPPRIADAFQGFPAWTAWVLFTEPLCALGLLAAGFTGNHALHRVSAGALAASYSLSSVAMLVLHSLGRSPGGDVVWHEAYPSIIVIGLLPFLRIRTVMFFAWALFTVVGLLALGDPERNVLVNVMYVYSLGGFSVAVAYSILGIAHESDAESARTRARFTEASVAEAEQIERERVDGLIHDLVMSTLLAASSVGSEPRIATSAQNAIRELGSLRTHRTDEQLVPVEEFARSLRAGLHFIDPTLTVTTSIADAPSRPILPTPVARDLTAAATEALRNSVTHAGGHHRSASVLFRDAIPGTGTGPRVEIIVEDDGPGYDPRTVPHHRMGARASIVGRMEALPGARAEIKTSPGTGVRVTLTWGVP